MHLPVRCAQRMLSAGDEQSLRQLRQLKDDGALDQGPLDDETAKQLLSTPVKPALVAPDKKEERFELEPRQRLPLTGATVMQILQHLEEETAAFNAAVVDNTTLIKDHLQRSLLQLFENTVRDHFVADSPQAMPPGRGSVAGAGAFAARRPTRTTGATPGSASKRPVDRTTGSIPPVGAATRLPSIQRKVSTVVLNSATAGSGLSDYVLPDQLRQDMATSIGEVLGQELGNLERATADDATKVTAQLVALTQRMTAIEEETMQSRVELRVTADQLDASQKHAKDLEQRLADSARHCDEKELQMDVLRDQVGRRNALLDDARSTLRKEVMRHKARIVELEMELDAAGVKRRERRASFDATFEDGNEASAEVSAAVEVAVRRAEMAAAERERQLELRLTRDHKDVIKKLNARVSEREHEVHRLMQKLKGDPGHGPGAQSAMSPAALPRQALV